MATDTRAPATTADIETQNLQAVQKILRIVAALPQPQRTHVLIASGQAVGVHLTTKASA